MSNISSFFFGKKETKTSSKVEGSKRRGGTQTEQLEIDKAGVDKILADILGGTQGLGDIFSQEQVSGLYGSSVAAQASGNLVANLAGEIAKLTAKKTTTFSEEEEVSSDTQGTGPGDRGLIGDVGSSLVKALL